PSPLPLFMDPPATEDYAKYSKELHDRERRVVDFVAIKHAEVVAASKSRAGDYMLAVQALGDQPTTEEFMLLADGDDLNPKMVTLWRKYLHRTRKGHHAVFAPWNAMAHLPAADFAV